MSIYDLKEKIKPFYTLFLCIIIAVIFFILGRLSIIEERKTPIRIIQSENGQTANVVSATSDISQNNNLAKSITDIPNVNTSSAPGEVIGSKNGKKYYFPWCGTVKMIKPENQVKFASIDLARKAGYFPAGNCKGLK